MDWKVLIVDDEPVICRTLKNYLSLEGFEPLTANGGEEALAIARREKVHIALLDIKMPGMDGITLLGRLRELDFSMQVIMMTGFSTFDLTLQALEKGATDYILKPFDDMDEIVHLVRLAAEKLERWKRNLAGSARKPSKGDPDGKDAP
jgi:YesN/AraC family two-component response regulator